MAVKPAHILGMNARYRYTKLNPYSAKRFGFSKLQTKELLIQNNIPTAQIFHTFESLQDLENINWEIIPVPFVIKPVNGSAGKGILIITKKFPKKMLWQSSEKENFTEDDLNLHVSNILDGEFSTWGSTHLAIIEEMIPPHPELAQYAYRGTPDIRVVVFNSIPIMAMARIPTKESSGKANLDQGAIGLGIDMATGITTYGVVGKKVQIKKFPGTSKNVTGIKIPQWKKVLTTAVEAAQAAGFVFMGADMFIHPDKGPMVVELNGYPGLSIQICNKAGLKRRLERVEDLEVTSIKHGVKIAQALFAHNFSEEIDIDKQKPKVIPTKPEVIVYDENNLENQADALVNTGRYRSAISETYAHKLGLFDIDDLLWRQLEGNEGKVPVVEVKLKIKDKKITTAMMVVKRLNRAKHNLELGRKDLDGFLVGDVEQ
jgi:alpha-L-glutamate ligase-like protein